jgi:hypothetical protein
MSRLGGTYWNLSTIQNDYRIFIFIVRIWPEFGRILLEIDHEKAIGHRDDMKQPPQPYRQLPAWERLRLERAKDELLRAHRRFIETNGAEGMRLNLSGADLRQARFVDAIMDEAVMAGARFWRANFNASDQRGSSHRDVMQGRPPRRRREQPRGATSDHPNVGVHHPRP